MFTPFGDLSKHGVDSIEPIMMLNIIRYQEELRTTGVGLRSFGHRNDARIMLETVVCFVRNGPRSLLAFGLI